MQAKLKDGQPCEHKGCLSHVSHPCEGCGRVAGRTKPIDRLQEIRDRDNEAKKYGWGGVVGYVSHTLQNIPYLLDAPQQAQEENKTIKLKIDSVCDSYKEMEHKNKLLNMALRAANDGNDTDDLRYSYEPNQGVEQLRSLCNGVVVHIPVDWLNEIVDNKNIVIDGLQGLLQQAQEENKVLKNKIDDAYYGKEVLPPGLKAILPKRREKSVDTMLDILAYRSDQYWSVVGILANYAGQKDNEDISDYLSVFIDQSQARERVLRQALEGYAKAEGVAGEIAREALGEGKV
jgi:hypothetical protein